MDGNKIVYVGWEEIIPEYTLTYQSNGGTLLPRKFIPKEPRSY